MLDFVMISTRRKTNSRVEVYPHFNLYTREDLMVRGKDFYAVWNEETQLWSTEEKDVIDIIDKQIKLVAQSYEEAHPEETVIPCYMKDSDSGSIDKFHKYVQKQCRDKYKQLDATVTFSNTETKKEDYISKKLTYPLEKSDASSYEEVISTLYDPKERHKIEWAIGSIVAGASKNIQKFLVMYGAPGTGKSTILNIIAKMFEGYCAPFEAQALGSSSATFAMEAFKANPLVAIQHEGDLSKIEDNTRINSIVSHETMLMNEKNKPQYPVRFNTFMFMGTNKPVKITDSKSGILRRLIDVSPSGRKIPNARYIELIGTGDEITGKVKFELAGIAWHCLQVYQEDPRAYDNYIPTAMIGATNDFFNFVLDSYDVFKRDDQTTLKAAYEMYKVYCDDARVPYPLPQRPFKEELKSYFKEFEERSSRNDESGIRPRNVYRGFLSNKFLMVTDPDALTESEEPVEEKEKTPDIPAWLKFTCVASLLDVELLNCPAQYAVTKADGSEVPNYKWENVKTKLSDIDTKLLHYVKPPDSLIVIDFDLKDADGNKSYDLNAKAAALWPETYAELSKGGQGVHLHYYYNGDVSKLSSIYDDQIEVKVFTGGSSLRRRLSFCNDIPITTISSGLPLKEENKKMLDFEGLKNDRAVVTYIKRCIAKEYAPSTRQSMSLLKDTLDKVYESGIKYDVNPLYDQIKAFALNSTNNADWCYKVLGQLKLKSEDPLSDNFEKYDSDTLVFFDVEVFVNLFVVCYMAAGHTIPVKLINPTATDISELVKYKLIGFNNLKYDNHILYARMLGYNNKQLFELSQALVNNQYGATFSKARDISYTDVFDFATIKQSLKKWEIAMGEPHMEIDIPWDQPVPEELWEKVAEYCANDVKATAALFYHLKEDWKARQVLADLAGGTVNDTTNTLTTKLVFGNDRKPQLVYTDLATGQQWVGR